ncbi:hypothetical protein I4U23_000227 [Adineta vaga]|nr:hypothetical protein I4U23_000227 [Adineta vaga]
MKVFLFFLIILTHVFLGNSLPGGTMSVICPNGDGVINCKEVKCCSSDKSICCLDESAFKGAIRMGCASVFPEGHPLGC